MRKPTLAVIAALLLLHAASLRAGQQESTANATKAGEALWRFDTHG